MPGPEVHLSTSSLADLTAAADPFDPLLQVEGLTVRFGPFPVVDSISYRLGRGQTLGIVGESGCGKSMTALALLGLVPPPGQVNGSIRFDGTELAGLPDRRLRRIRGKRIGMVFQEPMSALNPAHTVGAQIGEVLRIHDGLSAHAAHDRAVELLHRVGIPAPARRADSYPHQLSGGMRQRAMIAMALACGPDLLIADEPTTALDVTVQAQILDLIVAMQAEFGMAVQFISHNLAVVSEVADEVAVMYAGRIVELAPAAALFDRPMHPYTRGLLATVPRIGRRDAEHAARLPAIGGTVPGPTERGRGCPFANRCSLADDRCREMPPLANHPGAAPDHLAACWRAGL